MQALKIHPVKTRRQIADEFNINERTLRRWLKAEGILLPHRLLTPAEQLLIYQKFGHSTGLPTLEPEDQKHSEII